jgi:hypothetical protein
MGKARSNDSWVIPGILILALGGLGSCGERGPRETDSAGSATANLRVGGAIPLSGDRVPSAKAGAARFRATPGGIAANASGHSLELRGAVTRIQRVTAPLDFRAAAVARARTAANARFAGTGLLGVPSVARPTFASTVPSPATAPAFELETVSIARAGFECVTAGAPLAVASDGGGERQFGRCSERWTTGAAASEVGFHFAARPEGSGDLTIALRAQLGASGAPMAVTSDARGLRFGAGGEAFRFGHGTWIDAAGNRTPVAARWTGTTIQLTVPAAVLETSRYPAVLDPIVGPDLGTDTPVLVPASAGIDPDIGFDGTNFLVTFEDHQRIRAVRVDPAGNVLDFDWIDFGEDGQLQFTPNVAFGGGHYLVSWWQDDGTNLSIRGRLLDTDGNLVGTTSFPISSDESIYAAVAWTGDSFLAGWSSLGASPGVHVAIIDATGTVVPGSERQVSVSGSAFKPRIGANATQSLIAWEEENDIPGNTFGGTKIRAARVAHDGTVLDPVALVPDSTTDSEDHAGVASDGQNFLLTWHRSSSTAAPSTIEGAVVGADGTFVAPEFSISRSSGETELPSVAFDGTRYLVAWQDQRDVPAAFGTAVSTAGTVLGDADTQLSSLPIQPTFDRTALAWNGADFLLAFLGARDVPNGPFISGMSGSLIAPDLSIAADSLSFAGLPNSQVPSAAVWNGQRYLVTWIDDRNLAFDQDTVRGVLISSGSQVLDPAGIPVSGTLNAFSQSVASTGSANGRSLVTWISPTGRGLVRAVGANGALGPVRSLAPAGFSVASPIVSNGDDYFVLLERANADGQHVDLFGTRLNANGTPGPLFVVQRLVDFSNFNALVAGTDYVVTFAKSGDKLVTISNGGRVSPAVASPIPSTVQTFATNGRNALVSWVGPSGELLASFFARGAFRGPTLTIAPSTDGFPAAVGFDGRRYWLVWAGDRDTEFPLMRSVDLDGTLGDPQSLFNDGCEDPSLASNGREQLLLTCFYFRDNFQVIRVSTRLIDTAATAAVAAN